VPTEADPRDGPIDTIRTPRLELVSMSIPFMRALATRDLPAAEAEIDARVPEWMSDELELFLQYRLAQLDADPSIREWLGRAIVLIDDAGDRHVIGSVGFHGPPDDQGRLEIGYSIEPGHRRRGYAGEAARALLDWAASAHGVHSFIASISPTNEPSLRLAAGFGFVQTGSHIDEVDGLELVFETEWPPAARSVTG